MNEESGRQSQEAEDNRGKRKTIAGSGRKPRNPEGTAFTGSCETLCEIELCEQFKQSAQALELLHERKMWNEQKPYCLSAARKTIFANDFPHLE